MPEISTDDQQKIDQLCDQAEAAWSQGKDPDLGQWISDEWGDALPVFLTELIKVDLEVNKNCPTKLLTDYTVKFPAHREEFERVFQFIADSWFLSEPGGRLREPKFAPMSFIGRTIGDYEIQELLSVGGFGIVYRAIDKLLQRSVVIKIPRHVRCDSQSEIDHFLDEARKAANLFHRNIISVYHVGVDSGVPFIVEEIATQGDLVQYIQNPPGLERAVELIRLIVSAAGYAHQRGIVHRDLKPSNILISSTGEPVIADFGLAIRSCSGPRGQIAGTIRYMSPEQIRGEADLLDGRSDIWSIGVIFYELLTGLHLNRNSSQSSVNAETVLEVTELDLDAIDNKQLRRICAKCVALNVEDRYQSSEELEHDLVAVQISNSGTRFQVVGDQFPGMILRYVFHADGTDEILYANSGVKRILGVEPEEAMQNPVSIWRLIHPADLQQFVRNRRESMKSMQAFTNEFRVNTPHRGMRWCQSNNQPELLENGDVAWDCFAIDITDQKKAQAAQDSSFDRHPKFSSKRLAREAMQRAANTAEAVRESQRKLERSQAARKKLDAQIAKEISHDEEDKN